MLVVGLVIVVLVVIVIQFSSLLIYELTEEPYGRLQREQKYKETTNNINREFMNGKY
jgi:hypothetical protein